MNQAGASIETEAAGLTAVSVGERLRAAREARSLSVADAAAALKLSVWQIEALESGVWSTLPGVTFIRGFVRNYAKWLGLDAEALLASIDAGGILPKVVALVAPVSMNAVLPDGKRTRSKSVWLACAVFILLMLFFWPAIYGKFFGHEAPPVEVESIAEASGESSADGVADAASVVPPTVANNFTPPPVNRNAPILFSVTGESWVEVRDANGKVLMAEIPVIGSERSVDGTPPFSLVIGNARTIKLFFKNKPVDLTAHTSVNGVARVVLPLTTEAARPNS